MCKSVIETILKRRSVRRYSSKPVADDDLSLILEAGRQAPSAANRQPWSFVIVRNFKLKKKLAASCNNQMWLAEAAVIVAAVGWPKVSPKWYKIDVAIALQNIVLAAASLGYGTCWIGGFDQNQVREILGIPEYLEVVALTPIGVQSAEEPTTRPRKDFNDICFVDKFDRPFEDHFLAIS